MRALLLALALFVAAPAVAQVATLEPVDEAAADPSFVLFRARLLEAVAVRDTAFVLAHLHPDVKVSFGAENGVDEFRRIWLDESSGADLWTELAAFLPFGSSYQEMPLHVFTLEWADARAVAPYWYTFWSADSHDAFEHVIIVGDDINVRAAPRADAPVLTQLSHAIVRAKSFDDSEWAPIVLESGEEGFVARRYVRSPIGYRMGFEKTAGRWQITLFRTGVAGD